MLPFLFFVFFVFFKKGGNYEDGDFRVFLKNKPQVFFMLHFIYIDIGTYSISTYIKSKRELLYPPPYPLVQDT